METGASPTSTSTNTSSTSSTCMNPTVGSQLMRLSNLIDPYQATWQDIHNDLKWYSVHGRS